LSDIVSSVRIRATEASRNFSTLLSRVAHGETIEVDRHGEVVAVVSPPRRSLIPGFELLELVDRLPIPDSDFAGDVATLPKSLIPPADHWQS